MAIAKEHIYRTTIFAAIMTAQYFAFSFTVSTLQRQDIAITDRATDSNNRPTYQHLIMGYSTHGPRIEGFEFGNGENCILLVAAEHGNEKGTTTLLTTLGEHLKKNPALVSTNNRVLILPLVNPDGYYERDDKLNARGVNLNRNFPTSDWLKKENDDPETYAGEQPWSESESLALKRAFTRCEPATYISFHARGALVSPEKNEASTSLGKWYSQKTGYECYTDWDFPGTATKWFAETTNRAAITVELSDYNKSDWEINRKGIFELISR